MFQQVVIVWITLHIYVDTLVCSRIFTPVNVMCVLIVSQGIDVICYVYIVTIFPALGVL